MKQKKSVSVFNVKMNNMVGKIKSKNGLMKNSEVIPRKIKQIEIYLQTIFQ